MHRRTRFLIVVLSSLLFFQSTVCSAQWFGPDNKPLPFENDDQVIEFLRDAVVVSQKELTSGVNRPFKMRLEKDGVQANAIFRTVNIKEKFAKLDGKLVPNFHDSFVYECASYEVSRLLGIESVPPCVRRRHEMIDGSMQLWIENARTENSRREKNIDPPRQLEWLRQKQTMRVLDALIYNFDRNQGNMLIDGNWKLWFIDHTRSFRQSPIIERPERIVWCEHQVWEKLKGLNRKQLSKRIGKLVSSVQINMLLKRRDKLVKHLEERIVNLGEEAVLYDVSEEPTGPVAGMDELLTEDDIPLTSSKLETSVN